MHFGNLQHADFQGQGWGSGVRVWAHSTLIGYKAFQHADFKVRVQDQYLIASGWMLNFQHAVIQGH